jgi:CRISPR-associated protein Cas1
VLGKALNQLRLVMRQGSADQPELKERWRNFERSVKKADDLGMLRGLEGSFSALYFGVFQQLLKYRLGFRKRIKHPPPDPINILLSLGYTLLFNSLYGLIEGYGFDPYAGFFHELSYGHAALVSDLMEEFRAPIVDRLVLNVINRRQISEKHFEAGEEKYRLTKEGLEIFLNGYRKQVTERRLYKEERLNFLQIMQKQVQHFRKFLQGKTDQYESFRAR